MLQLDVSKIQEVDFVSGISGKQGENDLPKLIQSMTGLKRFIDHSGE